MLECQAESTSPGGRSGSPTTMPARYKYVFGSKQEILRVLPDSRTPSIESPHVFHKGRWRRELGAEIVRYIQHTEQSPTCSRTLRNSHSRSSRSRPLRGGAGQLRGTFSSAGQGSSLGIAPDLHRCFLRANFRRRRHRGASCLEPSTSKRTARLTLVAFHCGILAG